MMQPFSFSTHVPVLPQPGSSLFVLHTRWLTSGFVFKGPRHKTEASSGAHPT